MMVTLSRKDRFLLALVRWLGPKLIVGLGSTWRITWKNVDLVETTRRQYGGVIYAFWHGQMLIPIFTHRQRQARIMISQSKDGEFIAQAVIPLGYVPIRGSSSRDGLRALFQIIGEGKAGHDIGITPDGPRGPRFQVQVGVVLLAQRSGLPVVPCGVAAKNRIELNSWDRFWIPKPFTPAAFFYGKPILVPRELTKAEIETKRQEIEQEMLKTQHEAEALFA